MSINEKIKKMYDTVFEIGKAFEPKLASNLHIAICNKKWFLMKRLKIRKQMGLK